MLFYGELKYAKQFTRDNEANITGVNQTIISLFSTVHVSQLYIQTSIAYRRMGTHFQLSTVL